jgi:hypothetical protein
MHVLGFTALLVEFSLVRRVMVPGVFFLGASEVPSLACVVADYQIVHSNMAN